MLEVNFIALLLAGVSSMVIGFLWYSPLLFAKPWTKLMGYSSKDLKKEQSKMGPLYGLSFVGSLVTAFILTHFIGYAQSFYGMSPLTTGLITAFWGWLGFVAPVQMTDVIFGSKKWSLFAINTGYQLVSMLAMGAIIGLLG